MLLSPDDMDIVSTTPPVHLFTFVNKVISMEYREGGCQHHTDIAARCRIPGKSRSRLRSKGAPLEPTAIQVMGSGLGWLSELRALASGSKLNIYIGAEMTGKSILLNLGLAGG